MSRSYGKVSDPAAAERYRTNICVTSAPRFTPKLFPLNRFFFSLSTVTCKTIYIKKKKWNPQLKVAVCSAAVFLRFFFFWQETGNAAPQSDDAFVWFVPGKKLSDLERVTSLKVYNWFANRRKEIKRRANIGNVSGARGGGSIGIIFFAQIYHASARCCRPNGTSSSYKKPQSWRVMGLMSRVLEDTPTATTSMGMTSQSR